MSKRENERQMLFWIDNDLHQKVRVAAAIEDTNMKEYICKVLEKHFEEKEKEGK